MPASWALSGPYFLAFGLLSGVAGFRVGWRFGRGIVLPVIQALFGWTAFLLAWEFVGPVWAAAAVLAWALGTTLASVYVFLGRPRETDQRVLRARAYRESMLDWLETGATLGARPREVLWYAAAAVLTANLASIAMGAILLNY